MENESYRLKHLVVTNEKKENESYRWKHLVVINEEKWKRKALD